MARVTVWGENIHDRHDPNVAAIYPEGMHATIAQAIRAGVPSSTVVTATLEQPEHGLDDERLAQTDVLIWWGHTAHHKVADAVVDRIQHRVLDGMGLIVLHSGHESKIFRRMMGTHCSLRWREAQDRELIWTVAPQHPIAAGVPHPIVLERHEMYGEFFDIPPPDELVFVSSYTGGEVFRSGCCFLRGKGRIFYFSPGHETYPIYHDPRIARVLCNAVAWAAPLSDPQAGRMTTRKSINSPTNWFVGGDVKPKAGSTPS